MSEEKNPELEKYNALLKKATDLMGTETIEAYNKHVKKKVKDYSTIKNRLTSETAETILKAVTELRKRVDVLNELTSYLLEDTFKLLNPQDTRSWSARSDKPESLDD